MPIRLGAARRIEGLVGFGESSSEEAEIGRYRGSVGVLVVGGATPAGTQGRPGVHGPHQRLVGVRLWVAAGDPCSCVAGERRPQERGHHRSNEEAPGVRGVAELRRREFEGEHRRRMVECEVATEGVRGRIPSQDRQTPGREPRRVESFNQDGPFVDRRSRKSLARGVFEDLNEETED